MRFLQNRGFEFLGKLDIEQFGAGEHPFDMVLTPKHGERNVEAESGVALRAVYDFFEVFDLDEGTGGFVDDDIGAGYERKTGKDGFLSRPSCRRIADGLPDSILGYHLRDRSFVFRRTDDHDIGNGLNAVQPFQDVHDDGFPGQQHVLFGDGIFHARPGTA